MKTKWMSASLAAAGLSMSCGVEDRSTLGDGVDIEPSQNDVRGFAVVNGDFTSSSISLLSADGSIESAAFISSASGTPGLSAALGGDLTLPSTTMRGDELVIIDRFPASVLTWVSLETADVRAQLSVATGFTSNPHDYVPFSATRAFVTRYEGNLMSGGEPFDGGDDVLVVDPASAQILDRIDLGPAFAGAPPGIHPRADRALLAGGLLRVLAVGLDADFTQHAPSRLISIDPETGAIVSSLVFEGMNGCGNAAPSPDGSELAVACGGAFGQDPALGFPDAGVVLVSALDEPIERARWTSAALGTGPVNRVSWLDADHLALLTFGRFSPDGSAIDADDEAHTVNVRDGSRSEAWLSTGPFSLGDIACSLAQGLCLVADAETDGGVLHTLAIDDLERVRVTGSIKPDPISGLPPRVIGTF